MADQTQVKDPELERAAKRLARPSLPFLAIAAVLLVVGVVLIIVGGSFVWILGIVLIALAGPPAAVGMGLLSSSAVAGWASRRRPFA